LLRTALILLALAAPLPALAEGCNPPQALRFAPGTSGGEAKGAVPPGMPDCLTVTARAGQVLEANISSGDRNAVFQLYPPGWRIRQNEFGGVRVSNPMLTPPDASRLRVTLPADGTYLFVIGAIRGGTDYTLRVTIR
jgi:hypothetical protein